MIERLYRKKQTMTEIRKDFCFCTLALGQRYRLMAQTLAEDLLKYAPQTHLIIYTDYPKEFSDNSNVVAFKHSQQSTLHCFNDKRFVLQKALSIYPAVIFVDADTTIIDSIPKQIQWGSGITACHKNLIKHLQKRSPKFIAPLKKTAFKLGIDENKWEQAQWIGESIYVITRDKGKEILFLKTWGKIANYLELNNLHIGDGNIMGIAAAKVGWTINIKGWSELNQVREHIDASRHKPSMNSWQILQKRIGYHYRLNRLRIKALKNFKFYYS